MMISRCVYLYYLDSNGGEGILLKDSNGTTDEIRVGENDLGAFLEWGASAKHQRYHPRSRLACHPIPFGVSMASRATIPL